MPVDRTFWKHNYFVKGKDGIPPYACPICSRGPLKLVGEVQEESGRYVRHHRDDDWEPDHFLFPESNWIESHAQKTISRSHMAIDYIAYDSFDDAVLESHTPEEREQGLN